MMPMEKNLKNPTIKNPFLTYNPKKYRLFDTFKKNKTKEYDMIKIENLFYIQTNYFSPQANMRAYYAEGVRQLAKTQYALEESSLSFATELETMGYRFKEGIIQKVLEANGLNHADEQRIRNWFEDTEDIPF